jgi:hypothetical protein
MSHKRGFGEQPLATTRVRSWEVMAGRGVTEVGRQRNGSSGWFAVRPLSADPGGKRTSPF